MQAQRIAIIDLGSNTARLILMNAVPGNAYRLEDEIREVVRLRQGMTAHVRYLAARLFSQLAPLHGYGSAEQELLDAAG